MSTEKQFAAFYRSFLLSLIPITLIVFVDLAIHATLSLHIITIPVELGRFIISLVPWQNLHLKSHLSVMIKTGGYYA